jgi:hypothetical protein
VAARALRPLRQRSAAASNDGQPVSDVRSLSLPPAAIVVRERVTELVRVQVGESGLGGAPAKHLLHAGSRAAFADDEYDLAIEVDV